MWDERTQRSFRWHTKSPKTYFVNLMRTAKPKQLCWRKTPQNEKKKTHKRRSNRKLFCWINSHDGRWPYEVRTNNMPLVECLACSIVISLSKVRIIFIIKLTIVYLLIRIQRLEMANAFWWRRKMMGFLVKSPQNYVIVIDVNIDLLCLRNRSFHLLSQIIVSTPLPYFDTALLKISQWFARAHIYRIRRHTLTLTRCECLEDCFLINLFQIPQFGPLIVSHHYSRCCTTHSVLYSTKVSHMNGPIQPYKLFHRILHIIE